MDTSVVGLREFARANQRVTPTSLDPSTDYVVTNPAIAGRALPSRCLRTATIPQADATLTTQMKSVGEAMPLGGTFKESLQKCLRPLEISRSSVRSEIFVATQGGVGILQR